MKLLVMALVGWAALHAQEPAGVIEGTVRDAISRQPVPGVEISLRGPASATATTDAAGAFRFANLAPESYLLNTKAAGYLDSSRGRFGETVRLMSAAATVKVTIELVPLADVEGRILDEEGDPVPGVGVYHSGNLLATSDADGHYALENLVPGDYRLALRVPYEVRRRTVKRDAESGEQYGYADTQYYPDAFERSGAVPIPIAGGMHLRQFVMRLKRTRLVALGGHVIEMAGRATLSTAEVELGGASADTFGKRSVDQDGAFRFDLIRPGHYTLLVYRASGIEALPYSVPVDVGNTGTEDLPVAVPPFARIPGALRLSDPKVRWEGEVRLSLSGAPGVFSPTVAASADGTFVLDGVPPGQWRLEVRASGLHRPDDRRALYVSRVMFGAQDAMAGSITVAESGNPPVEVILSGEAGQLAGTVTLDDPARPPMIVVRRTEGVPNLAQYIQPHYANQDGAFVVQDLIPGDYEVGAWIPDAFGATSIDPQRCGNRLAKVKIRAGETAAVRLEICNQ